MICIGFLIYLNEQDRIKKRNLFKKFFLDDVIEISIHDLENDFLGLIADKYTHIDKIIFYSITDLPEFFDEVIEVIDCLSNSKIEMYFMLENISINEQNSHVVLKMLQTARSFKKSKSLITTYNKNKELVNEQIKIYLESGKYSVSKIAELTGLSVSTIYLRQAKMLKNKIIKNDNREILTLKK